MKTLLSFAFCAIYSCATNNPISNPSARSALNLIQACVDATLRLDPGLNSTKYSVDFGVAKDVYRQGIVPYLQLNPNATEGNLDSLYKYDANWAKYQFFENPVIKFEEIKEQSDGTILIHTSKTKSADGAIGTEIILKKQVTDSFKCISSKITRIS